MENIKCDKLLVLIFLFSFLEFTNAQYQIQEAFPNLTFTNAVDFQNAGDGTDRIFVVEQAGIIKVFQNDPNASTTKIFLDITDRVSSGGEMGLLGLGFHPDYETNGYFYVNYTISSPRTTRISRFQVTSNPDSANKNSELILISITQPFANHNGGQVSFGPDGYLYLALGDGGSGGDPNNNAQNKASLLGKILRIDVNSTQGVLNYAIPPTNPYAGNTQGFREEIFVLGMRNPWRFSFDAVTGWLWCADVGQNDWEEINVLENGNNYGWRCYEGLVPYNTTGCTEIYEDPIWVYSHNDGISVTGGFVYRGPNVPGLYGKYIYSDYGSGNIWSIEYDGVNPAVNTLLLTVDTNPVSFGVDQNNELYICAFSGSDDKIYRFVPTAEIIAPSNLGTNIVPPDGIQLNWNDNSNNETGFKIERKTIATSFIVVDSVGANVTGYLDTGLEEEIEYTYRVFAFNNTGVSGYSNQASDYLGELPVELVSFKASNLGNSVVLNWQTKTETDNYGFEIERTSPTPEAGKPFPPSNEGGGGAAAGGWEKLGFIQGNGNSSSPKDYSFVDNNPDGATSFQYRLKQIDYDGQYKYSDVINISVSIVEYALLQNYPNPFNPSTKIKYSIPTDTDVTIVLYDILGTEVKTILSSKHSPGNYELNFEAGNIASGIYFYQIQTPDFSRTMKMIIMK